MTFILDSRLEKDTLFIHALPLCQVRLMNDARYPWVLLVPQKNDVQNILDLTEEEALRFHNETRKIAAVMKELYKSDRLNIAMLGNVVPQLHLHCVARFEADETFPAPIWGRGQAVPYTEQEAQKILRNIKDKINMVNL